MSWRQDHHQPVILRSPFYLRLSPHNHLRDWTDWNGYLAPRVLDDISAEYFAIRSSCSVMDLTPMEKYRISGPDAAAYLDRLVTRDVSALRPGRVTYVVWCNDNGRVLDDGTLFHLLPGVYRLCAQHHQLDWLMTSAIGFDVHIEEETHDVAALSVQGPTSCEVLRSAGLGPVEELKAFGLVHRTLNGMDVMVSRTGFTGDLGYEVWTRPENAVALWDAIFAQQERYDLRVIGLTALEMVRIEAGFLMPGFDFNTAETVIREGYDRSPFELGLDFVVDLGKANFTGQRALLQEKARAPARRLIKLVVAGNKPCADALLYDARKGRLIGAIKASTWSPLLKANLALAEVSYKNGRLPRRIWAQVYYQRELQWISLWARCEVREKPFYSPARRTRTPPPKF